MPGAPSLPYLSGMKASRLLALSLLFVSPVWLHANWPSWRGDLAGSGITKASKLPLKWGKEHNVRWRTPLPEPGNSTPVVHGHRVFVTQPITSEHWRGLFCFDLHSGELLWKNGLTYEKEERTHKTNPYCSASPVTDGEIVVASYGSAGVAAYDLDGKALWHRDLGPIDHEWGHSSSPLIHEGLCIVYHGPGVGAALYALDRGTGETVWEWKEPQWKPGQRTDGFAGKDDGIIGSFSTPILTRANGREELVMSFPLEMKAFDPKNGQVLWTCEGLNPLVYTSPMAGDGIIVAMGGYYGNTIAVRGGGDGNVTETHRLWQEVRHNGGIGTGVIKDGFCYYNTSGGIVNCLEVGSGKERWKARLPGAGKSWGSFVLAGDKIYALSQAGDTVVFRANPDRLEVLAQSDLGEETNSSPVPVDGRILIRTHSALWCLGEE